MSICFLTDLKIVYIGFGSNTEQSSISLSPNKQKTLLINVLKQAIHEIEKRRHNKQDIVSVILALGDWMNRNIKKRSERADSIESQI